MPGAETAVAQWGLFGVAVVVLASVALYLERERRRLSSELQTLQATSAAARETLTRAHADERDRMRSDYEARLEAQRGAHQREREAIQARLDQEHGARLSDQKEGTRALLSFTERMHEGIATLGRLADFISRQQKPPT